MKCERTLRLGIEQSDLTAAMVELSSYILSSWSVTLITLRIEYRGGGAV